MTEELQGTRKANVATLYADKQPGSYCKVQENGEGSHTWYIIDPAGNFGAIRTHHVTEHEDGTITVQPSILDPEPGGWHGWLERGVWRSV